MTTTIADTKAERRAKIEGVFLARAEGKPWLEGIFPHQWRGACYGAVAKRWILADDPGLGKTRTVTAWMDLIGARRVVLFAEANVCNQFADEIRDLAPHRRVVAVNGLDGSRRHSNLDDLPFMQQAVIVVNFEMFRRDRHALSKLTHWRADTVLVDEAHNLKATKTGNFKDVQTVVFFDNTCRECGGRIEGLYDEQYWEEYGRKKAKPCSSCGWRKPSPATEAASLSGYPNRLAKVLSTKSVKNLALLTGTPILNNPGDLYALVHLVDPVTWPQFDGQGGFKDRYLEQNYFTNRWEWQVGALEILKAELAGRFLQRKKADVFVRDDERRGWILPNGGFLPDQRVQVIDVTLDKERYPLQYRTIRQITERAMIELDSGEQTNIMAIIAIMTRKRQANVWPGGIEIKDKDGNLLFSVGKEVQESAKLDAVVENVVHLWQQGKRQVVFSHFTTALAELEKRLVRKGMRVARLDGSVTKKQREGVKRDFYAAKTGGSYRYDIVLAQYRSGGTGLNLTAATETHILDEEWSPGKRGQAYHRTFRIGQSLTTRVWIYRLRGTIDQWLANLLLEKDRIINEFEGTVNITKAEMKNSLLEGMRDGSIL